MHETAIPEENRPTSHRRILLIGNPNVGKSVVFGALTGRYVTVSNYPGTTVEIAKGSLHLDGVSYELVDTPGVNNLVPLSEDEQVTRDILLSERPESVLLVVDAKNLRRGLFIALQLAEMRIPFVIVLNMMDEARHRGIQIDTRALEKTLGVPVLPTVATQRKGLGRIPEAIKKRALPAFRIHYSEPVEQAIQVLEPLLPPCPFEKRSLALMYLCEDPGISRWIEERSDPGTIAKLSQIREAFEHHIGDSPAYRINRERLHAVDTVVSRTMVKTDAPRSTVYSGIHKWSTHPVYGVPFLLAVLAALYLFVGKFGAGTCVDFLEDVVFGRYLNPWSASAVKAIVPWAFLQDLIIGPYGIITMALTYSVAIVLPIVGTFFVAFGVLEDSGYLPRLAVMMNRPFRLLGLNGKAVLPMILGLGCDTMATITARILESPKERIIVTLLLALGVPCSAQLGVILAMLGNLSFAATILWAGVVVGVMGIVGYLAARLLPGRSGDFILEIPPLRVPTMSNIFFKTIARVEWYLKEAVPLFILGTLILFFSDRFGILASLERLASPVVVGFLGLPAKASEAFLVGFLRRDYGAAGLYALASAGQLTPVQSLVSLVTITLFVPCIANVFVIVKERGWRIALAMVAFIFPFAFLVGGALNKILTLLGVTL
jgi:ferrous iron transport protein B